MACGLVWSSPSLRTCLWQASRRFHAVTRAFSWVPTSCSSPGWDSFLALVLQQTKVQVKLILYMLALPPFRPSSVPKHRRPRVVKTNFIKNWSIFVWFVHVKHQYSLEFISNLLLFSANFPSSKISFSLHFPKSIPYDRNKFWIKKNYGHAHCTLLSSSDVWSMHHHVLKWEMTSGEEDPYCTYSV